MDTYNVLSLDGGGSRGVMEAFILKDLMACLTQIKEDPFFFMREEDAYQGFEDEIERNKMREKLDVDVPHGLHPGHVFKMVAGTSTGALMAFGLLHGANSGRMTLQEVIDMYGSETSTIFPQKWWWKSWLPGGIPWNPYTQDGLKKVLEAKFGKLTLGTISRKESCIAAAVARRHNNQHLEDQLDIFDTRQRSNHTLVDVLKASACAPVYFKTPSKIGNANYIDGGVGGNCPLAQAIPRMARIQGKNGNLQTVISIAPPRELKDLKEKGLTGWTKWFSKDLTDGYAVYHGQEQAYPNTTFIRLAPSSDAARKYNMDSLDVSGMIDTIRKESEMDPTYFQNIMLAAIILAPTAMDMDVQDIHNAKKIDIQNQGIQRVLVNYRQLSQKVGNFYKKNGSFSTLMKILRARLQTSEKFLGNENEEVGIDEGELAWCYYNMGMFGEAQVSGEKSYDINPDNMAARNIAAESYVRQGMVGKAIEILQVVKSVKKEEPDIAIAYFNLSLCYQAQGKYEDAIAAFTKGEEINEKVILKDQDKFYEASSRNKIGLYYLGRGWYDEAIEKFEEGLGLWNKIHKERKDHPQVVSIAQSWGNLGKCYELKGDDDDGNKESHYDTAQQKLSESLEVYGRYFPDGHSDMDGFLTCLQRVGEKREKRGEDTIIDVGCCRDISTPMWYGHISIWIALVFG